MRSSLCYQLLAALPWASAQTYSGFPVDITNSLEVVYGGISISNGQQLPRANVVSAPNISAPTGFSATGRAVLIMLDTDVPFNSTSRGNILHWLIQDVTGVTDGSNSTFLTLPPPDLFVTYRPPTPPQGDYPHRYSFLLYEQPRDFVMPGPDSQELRRGFDLPGFLNTSGIGAPLAANYMLVANVSGPAQTSFPPAAYTAASTLASSEAAGTATPSGSTSVSETSASTTESSASGTATDASGTASTEGSASTNQANAMKAGSGITLLAAIFGSMLM